VFAAVSLLQAAEPPRIENRRLAWTDFRGEPEANSPYDAYTYWSVHYSYDAPTPEGGGYRINVRVWNQLDDRSWVKPHVPRSPLSAELLNHEQGHYMLGVLCALEFKKASSERLFSPRYRVEIQDLFDQVLKKYVELEKAYDAETGHMRNRPGQSAWDRRLALLVSERWADR
jgi:hypothetical protein